MVARSNIDMSHINWLKTISNWQLFSYALWNGSATSHYLSLGRKITGIFEKNIIKYGGIWLISTSLEQEKLLAIRG